MYGLERERWIQSRNGKKTEIVGTFMQRKSIIIQQFGKEKDL